MTANLSNASGATGTANFNANTTGLKLSVSGATANSSLDVAVDGTSVGTLTTDASGNGKLQLASTDAAIQAGSTITVGDLAGTFTPTKLTASLTGDAGATGTAQFNVRRNDLGVSVSGAAASTTYNITIDNAVVGQFTTNSAGQASQAKTHLSLTDVTVQAGSILTISDTAGNPAIVQGVFA